MYLHSFHDRGDGWPDLLDRLAERFTVYAPFHPGVQGSEGVEQIDDVVDLGLAYDELLAALGIESAYLVGHFFGAMAAAELASLCPGRAKKVALLSPLGLWLDEKPVADVLALPAADLDALLWSDRQLGRGVPLADAARVRRGERRRADRADPATERDGQASSGRFRTRDCSKRLHRMAAPVLILWGSADRVNPPAYSEEFARYIEGATVRELPGGHMVHFESPDAVARSSPSFFS